MSWCLQFHSPNSSLIPLISFSLPHFIYFPYHISYYFWQYLAHFSCAYETLTFSLIVIIIFTPLSAIPLCLRSQLLLSHSPSYLHFSATFHIFTQPSFLTHSPQLDTPRKRRWYTASQQVRGTRVLSFFLFYKSNHLASVAALFSCRCSS